jgi:integrase/recombinase XerD
MKVSDFYIQNRRGWVRLHEKGGKVTELPCHHNLDQYLEEWIAAASLAKTPEAPLFPTLRHGRLSVAPQALPQANVHVMIQRRALAAGIRTKISEHSFRATGIINYLQNGGKLEVAQAMKGHESARTTGLYDRRNDAVALDEVMRLSELLFKCEVSFDVLTSVEPIEAMQSVLRGRYGPHREHWPGALDSFSTLQQPQGGWCLSRLFRA